MVADSCQFVFSCLRPDRRRLENMSFCHYFDLRVLRRRHGKQRATTRKISTRRHEIFNKEIFVPSPVKMSLFRLAYFVSSPRKSKAKITTKRHVFVSSPFAFRDKDTKTRNGINQPP